VIDVGEIVTLQARTCVGEMRLLHRALTLGGGDVRAPSLCLIGPASSCTFFYRPYRLIAHGTAAAVHYLASVLIGRALDTPASPVHPSVIADFLPGLAPFLFAEIQEIQSAAIEAAATAVHFISPTHVLQWYGRKQVSGPQSDAETLLFAMIAAVLASSVCSECHEQLFRFICQISESESLPRSLALVILLVGRDVWGKFQSKHKFFAKVARLLFAGRCLPLVQPLYSCVCVSDQETFFASVREILSESPTSEEGRALCSLISALALSHRSVFGARGSLELAKIAAGYAGFAEFAEQELARHAAAFRNVASDGESLAIGTADGWLYTFRKRKQMLETKICDGAIDCVSIGPGNWALALSLQQSVAKVVPFAKVGIIRPKERVIKIDVSEWNAECEIVWRGPDAGDVSIRCAPAT
jgi:hypothetical protein